MKAIKVNDILEAQNGTIFEVLQVLFFHKGIYELFVLDENGEKSIKRSYFFKGFETDNDSSNPTFCI
jgi:hypothetical protein